MMPRSSAGLLLPFIVYVLPEPVTPWANIVTSLPLKRCLRVGETMSRMGGVRCQPEKLIKEVGMGDGVTPNRLTFGENRSLVAL